MPARCPAPGRRRTRPPAARRTSRRRLRTAWSRTGRPPPGGLRWLASSRYVQRSCSRDRPVPRTKSGPATCCANGTPSSRSPCRARLVSRCAGFRYRSRATARGSAPSVSRRSAASRASVSCTRGGVPAPGGIRPVRLPVRTAAVTPRMRRPSTSTSPCTRQLVTASTRSLRSGAGRCRSLGQQQQLALGGGQRGRSDRRAVPRAHLLGDVEQDRERGCAARRAGRGALAAFIPDPLVPAR